MNLILDIGNTLQKIAVFDETDKCLFYQSFQEITKLTLASILRTFPVENSIISSVADFNANLVKFLEENTNMVHYSHKTKLPVTILFKTPETLGLDRIANAVGAAALHPGKNVLSIQAGTCLVYDFVNEKGEYLGGSISPGMQMRFAALHEKTKKLPLLKKEESLPHFLGTDSNNSILSGVLNGMCYEIEGFIEDYQMQFKDLTVLFTGGDATCLQKFIKNTIFAAPKVVLKGLNEIIKYNV
ncbi:MAG: type III pantothenate kinase [Lentimicrobiaceae bacterium]|nr:type III pantothenate kinase [Lentimicrobiaceae bacterium]